MLTVGYGELIPVTTGSRVLAILTVLIGVMLLSGIFSAVVSFLNISPTDQKLIDFVDLMAIKNEKWDLAATVIQRAFRLFYWRKYYQSTLTQPFIFYLQYRLNGVMDQFESSVIDVRPRTVSVIHWTHELHVHPSV